MKQWSLVALGLIAIAGCNKAASDTKAEEPVDQATLTGATVSRIPITPPPRIDETATKAGADEAEEMSPEPFWPPPMTTMHAGASGTLVSSTDQMVNPPPRGSASARPSFPESTFGDYNTPDAGAALPVDRDIPR